MSSYTRLRWIRDDIEICRLTNKETGKQGMIRHIDRQLEKA